MIKPKYVILLTFGIIVLQMMMSQIDSSSPFLDLRFEKLAFTLLNFNPLDCKVSLHFSKLVLTPSLVLSTKTMASTNNVRHDTLS